jgi:hypothetical protein
VEISSEGFCRIFRYVLEVKTLTLSVENLLPILAARNLVSASKQRLSEGFHGP